MKKIKVYSLLIFSLGIAIGIPSYRLEARSGSRVIKLTDRYIREKGAQGIEAQLNYWSKNNFTLSFDENALGALSQALNLGSIQKAGDLIQRLNTGGSLGGGAGTVGKGVGTGTGSGTGFEGKDSGAGGTGTDTGIASGTGTGTRTGLGTGDRKGGTGSGKGGSGGMMPGFSGLEIGDKQVGAPEAPPMIPIEKEEEVTVSTQEEEKIEEREADKEKPKVPEKIPFEYTLEPSEDDSLSAEKKEKSDEAMLDCLVRVMQTVYDAKQQKIVDIVIDSKGVATGPFERLVPQMQLAEEKALQKIRAGAEGVVIENFNEVERMKFVEPANGFEAYYEYLKDRLIVLVGYNKNFEKREELRALLGSEEKAGLLKNFLNQKISKENKGAFYDFLHLTKFSLIDDWIAIFSPCFFNKELVLREDNRRILETILINCMVSHRSKANVARTAEIISDEFVEKLILELFVQVAKEVPSIINDAQEQPTEGGETGEDAGESVIEKKEATKNKLTNFFKAKLPGVFGKGKNEKKEQGVDSLSTITFSKDYALALYDLLNRLRASLKFSKPFEVLGLDAAKNFQAMSAKGGVNARLAAPLLLWLLTFEAVQTGRDFRDLAAKQILFEKEDFELALKEPTIAGTLNAVFDFHMKERKKHKKKIDVTEFLNKELMAQTNIKGVRQVIKRLNSIIEGPVAATVKNLEKLEESKIETDNIFAFFKSVIDQVKGEPLENEVSAHLKKLIDTHNKANEKTALIGDVLDAAKSEYDKTKQPVTKIIYDKFLVANKKLKPSLISDFKLKEVFYGMYRMPGELYSFLARLGGKLPVNTKEFFPYTHPYGLLLKVFSQTIADSPQPDIVMLKNTIQGMNSGILKTSERYAEAFTSEMKDSIKQGIYKDRLQDLVNAFVQNDVLGVRKAIDSYIKIDPINPSADPKQKQLYDKLLSDIVAKLSQSFLNYYAVSIETLNSGSGTCPESVPDCLIPGISLDENDRKVRARNALFYQSLKGKLKTVIDLLKPNGNIIAPEQLKVVSLDILKQTFDVLVAFVKDKIQEPSFDSYWSQKAQMGQLNNEQQQIIAKVQSYINFFVSGITSLQAALVPSAGASQPSGIPVPPSGIPLPPPIPGTPPPPPMPPQTDAAETGVPPAPPPPPF